MFNQYLFNEALFNEGAGAVVTVAAQENLLYVFDAAEALTAIIPASDYTEAKHYEKLNGENRFSFKIVNDDYMAYLTVGSLVAFLDFDSYWQFFEVKQVTDTHKNTFEKQVSCQHCLYELIDDIVTDVRPSTTALAAMTSVLANTRWNVGIVDDLGTASCNVYYESALAGVQKVAEAWGGELRWRCLILGGVITRYVDLLLQRGADTGKTFSYDKDIEEINREIDLTDVCTAMYGRGKGVETDTGGYGRRLTFEDEVWTVAGGDPADKPADQEWVGDTTALALYGRPGNRHRYGVYTNDQQTDAATLLQETWDYLQTVNTPRATYQLKAIVLEMLSGYAHEAVRLGDTVRVIDEAFTPELKMSARVIELERDLLDPSTSSVTVGNFAPSIVETTFNVQKELRDVKNSTYNTKWLDGTISVLQNEINNTQSYVFQTPGDGILIMDAATFASATKAMKIGGGIFALANSKTGDQWNWRTFGTGAGFTADEITTGLLDAALVQIGPQTTFAPGYDPTKGSMGVDSDCLGLWHFDGSLNSHKGVTAIGDETFDTGCFGQAVMVEEGTTNLLTANQASVETDTTGFEAVGDATISRDTAEHWDGLASLKVVTTATQWTGVSTVKQAATAGTTYTASVYVKGSGTVVLSLRAWDDTPTFIGQQQSASVTLTGTWQRVTVTYAIPSGATKMDIAILTDTANAITFYADGLQLEEKAYYATTFVIATRLGVLKAPTTGLSASQGTISLRAKNLSASANGSVLVDLPKSDNTQGMQAGIANDGKIYITDSTTTAYGPNKSTLTAWDSISLAWKSDRLSLVVNDTEACYIENPGLPTAFGSYLFVGTDRNSANAINTLVDELRVDKVYKDVAIRTAWHKTGSPFYTSEEMKQWPGYVKVETDGLKVYDSSNALRVLVGSWLKDAIRRYGLKVIAGLFMSGDGPNRMEFNEEGLVGFYNNVARIKLAANQIGYIQFFASDGVYSGYMGADDATVGIIGLTPNKDLDIALVPGAGKRVNVSGNLHVSGNITKGGSVSYIEPTLNYGSRLLYIVETPELLYYDRGVTHLTNGEAVVKLDPIFLECIEPDTGLTPWQVWVECYGENGVYVAEVGADYFKIKERNGGTSNNKVVWRFEATRKNYAGIRLMEVVD